MRSIETKIRVRYADTDMSGIVYNANYLVWFEVARGEFFWQEGKDYGRDIEARGYHWPVIEANLRYHAPAFYGDLVTVRAWIEDVKSRAMTIRYEVWRDESKLCSGYTKHMNIDKQGRPTAFPEDIRKLISSEE
ncbi:MAG: acyl-CoA thioesterase [Anaerolineae bacterium]|nr:acyl-CoA thioesterase [Anaerolineae bacterium]